MKSHTLFFKNDLQTMDRATVLVGARRTASWKVHWCSRKVTATAGHTSRETTDALQDNTATMCMDHLYIQ
jgi:hypothetical protein